MLADNAAYVQRGRDPVIRHDPGRADGPGGADPGKEGAPFRYADGMIMPAAAPGTALGVPYRQLSGMAGRMLDGHDSPCYTTIHRRMKRLDVGVDGDAITVLDAEARRTMIADATGLKQWNRGEWIRKRWRVHRGFVKLHLLTDAETGAILAAVVTDDRAGDAPVLPRLLGMAVTSPIPASGRARPNMLAGGTAPLADPGGVGAGAPGCELLADGAYASRGNVALCGTLGIDPLMRMRHTCTAGGMGKGDAWGLAVRRQLGGGPQVRVDGLTKGQRLENRRYWKSTVGYGRRWGIERVIAAFKQIFGEHLHARKRENMVREVAMRIILYNRWVCGMA